MKDVVGPETFFALDLRVGRIVEVGELPGARIPAWKVAVDFGDLGTLWTSARITHYTEDELVGRLVVGAVNLGSKRIAGFRSEFLLLGGNDAAGVVHLLAPDGGTPGDEIC